MFLLIALPNGLYFDIIGTIILIVIPAYILYLANTRQFITLEDIYESNQQIIQILTSKK